MMMFHSRKILFVLLASSTLLGRTTARAAEPAFAFDGVDYFHRWSQAEQHEFTPEKQTDLEKWTDMITVNGYPSVHEGEGLAAQANGVLENYKAHQAVVLKTDSTPRTADRPAEHFIAVAFTRPTFIEVVFARFKLADGMGCSLVYSHRLYGAKIGDQMSAWIRGHAPALEKALMSWRPTPSPKSLGQETKRTTS